MTCLINSVSCFQDEMLSYACLFGVLFGCWEKASRLKPFCCFSQSLKIFMHWCRFTGSGEKLGKQTHEADQSLTSTCGPKACWDLSQEVIKAEATGAHGSPIGLASSYPASPMCQLCFVIKKRERQNTWSQPHQKRQDKYV